MPRPLAVILRLAIAIVIALALLGLWLMNLPEAARQLFLFMDIGLGVWLVLLIVGAVRGWGIPSLLVAAVIGAVLNLLTVTVVGLIQSGELPWEFIGWAVQAGLAFLVGAAVAVLVVKPRRPATAPA